MNRSGLKFLAVVLTLGIVAVLFAGLDNLPRSLRHRIEAERASLSTARTQVMAAQDQVNRDLQTEAALFASIPSAQQWPQRLSSSAALIASATSQMDELTRLEKQNRRQDRARVEYLLSKEGAARSNALADATATQKEAAHWLDLKQHLPEALQQMERNHRAIDDFDLASLSATVQKAGNDWSAKKPDLDARLTAERDMVAESDRLWDSTAEARQKAAAGGGAGLNYGALLGAVDRLQTNAAQLPAKAAELKSLTAQLYTSWDRVLVDMETRGRGGSKEYQQKIRTIQTTYADAAAKAGNTTSEERWTAVPRSTYDGMRENLGMAIAHKPTGKYDSEADRVPQPAGFAYMASPAQGSNQYGRWERRDGRDFWVFYGQYALLRDLLFNRDYRPLDRGDWDGYRGSQTRGQTYYGKDSGGQRYGTQGSSTQERYSGSTYAKKGGFRDSPYAAKNGTYRNSPFSTPSAREPGSSSSSGSGRTFGRTPSVPSGRSYRSTPSPRPSFHFPSGSGRRFGRR